MPSPARTAVSGAEHTLGSPRGRFCCSITQQSSLWCLTWKCFLCRLHTQLQRLRQPFTCHRAAIKTHNGRLRPPGVLTETFSKIHKSRCPQFGAKLVSEVSRLLLPAAPRCSASLSTGSPAQHRPAGRQQFALRREMKLLKAAPRPSGINKFEGEKKNPVWNCFHKVQQELSRNPESRKVQSVVKVSF